MTAYAPLIIDIAGTTLSPDDERRLMNPLVGGLVLFTRNWSTRDQLTALTRSIKQLRADLLICVDHEGGRVQRFRQDGFTHLPAMRTLGKLWEREAMVATNAATATGYVLASQLRSCGVDLSFTPVLDIDWGQSSVIGDRSFHNDSRVVTLLAKSVLHGMLHAGMSGCGKHFPGHGWASADSHVAVPVDERGLEQILERDAAAYGWLDTALPAVMAAHVVYPQVDSRPAGYSKRWLGQILRKRLHYCGVVFSDDLSMQGARQIDGRQLSMADAVVAALQAGCDLALLCNQSLGAGETLDEAMQGLGLALEKSALRGLRKSARSAQQLLPQGPALNWEALMEQPQYQKALKNLPS